MCSTIYADIEFPVSMTLDSSPGSLKSLCILQCEIFVCFIVTATADSDYISLSSSSLVFPDGSNSGDMQCMDIAITNDEILEINETFTVSLTVLTQRVMAVNAVTAITIIDDES